MKQSELGSIRDTIQSIWVAIILAFVLRAFMLEAFEIPTGSMAPRLMGHHALVTCPDCQYQFQREWPENGPSPPYPGRDSTATWCPNCRERILRWALMGKSGDRVLVLKIPRMLRPLQRWDVVVFKEVKTNQQNYIKRLVGLPGEALRIIQGDVYVRPIEDSNDDGARDERDLGLARDELAQLTDWRIARKPHRTQAAMWQLLFDNDYQPANVNRQVAWEPLWETADAAAGAWRLDLNAGRVFGYNGDAVSTLRFARGREEVFLPTNAYNSHGRNNGARAAGPCSDLRLETALAPVSGTGSAMLTLSSRHREFAGEVDFSGQIRLLCRSLDERGQPETGWDQAEVWLTEQVKPLEIGRPVSLALTHVDWRVTVWVDGDPVLVTTDQQYRPDVPALLADGAVLTPRVGITGLGGEFELWHTRVLRDVYYTCPNFGQNPAAANGDYLAHFEPKAAPTDEGMGRATDTNHTPRYNWVGYPGWGTQDNPIALRRYAARPDYDEFFMLGDNSPSSSDSRLWLQFSPSLRLYDELGHPQYRPGTVPRYNMIGKAFFVYWPAGTRLPKPINLPLVPDVGKMRRIN